MISKRRVLTEILISSKKNTRQVYIAENSAYCLILTCVQNNRLLNSLRFGFAYASVHTSTVNTCTCKMANCQKLLYTFECLYFNIYLKLKMKCPKALFKKEVSRSRVLNLSIKCSGGFARLMEGERKSKCMFWYFNHYTNLIWFTIFPKCYGCIWCNAQWRVQSHLHW